MPVFVGFALGVASRRAPLEPIGNGRYSPAGRPHEGEAGRPPGFGTGAAPDKAPARPGGRLGRTRAPPARSDRYLAANRS